MIAPTPSRRTISEIDPMAARPRAAHPPSVIMDRRFLDPVWIGRGYRMMLDEEFLTEEQVAEMLGVRPSTLRNWAALRRGPPRIKVGKKVLYRRTALVAWLEDREKVYQQQATRNGRGRRGRAA